MSHNRAEARHPITGEIEQADYLDDYFGPNENGVRFDDGRIYTQAYLERVERLKVYKCVVPLSGGKDSQACLKMAVSEYGADFVLGLFCDPQFEHPLTSKHIDHMRALYGVKIEIITAGSVDEKVLKYKRFPGGGARHCTDELKIRPSREFYKTLAEKQGGFVVYYGMRADESSERNKRYAGKKDDTLYPPHLVMDKYPKYLEKMGVMFKMPILNWTANQVFDYLDGEENPLYSQGFDRVGCFPCLASGDTWKEKAFGHDDFGRSQRIRVKNLEDRIGKDIFTSKGGCQRNNPDQTVMFDSSGCGFCEI
jgi:3'-phosphoadenosine 5'-phosphosulfate sulfotransferase (PAPS reductase)/FAD synthetase